MLFNFDYKDDLMKLAVERERVFTLRTFEEKRLAAEEYEKLNPILKPTVTVKVDEREEESESSIDSEEDQSKVIPTPGGASKTPGSGRRNTFAPSSHRSLSDNKTPGEQRFTLGIGNKTTPGNPEKIEGFAKAVSAFDNVPDEGIKAVRPGIHTKFDEFKERPAGDKKYL